MWRLVWTRSSIARSLDFIRWQVLRSTKLVSLSHRAHGITTEKQKIICLSYSASILPRRSKRCPDFLSWMYMQRKSKFSGFIAEIEQFSGRNWKGFVYLNFEGLWHIVQSKSLVKVDTLILLTQGNVNKNNFAPFDFNYVWVHDSRCRLCMCSDF